MSSRNAMLALYLAKIEATEGADAVPTAAANAIELVANVDPAYDLAFTQARDAVVKGADINAQPPLIPKGKIFSWSKSAWFRGTALAVTAGNPIPADPWLQAAGFAATYSGAAGAEQVQYTLASTLLKSITEYFYHDGVVRKGVGARAELGISFDVGGPCVIECASQGIFTGVSDAALPAGPAFSAVVPPTATDMTACDIDGYAAGVVRSFKLQTGNTIARRNGVKSVGGVAGFDIRQRKATFSIVLEEPTRTAHNFDALIDSQADVVIHWLLGALKYNTLDFNATGAKIDKVTPSNDNGLPLLTITGGLYAAPGGSPLALTVK